MYRQRKLKEVDPNKPKKPLSAYFRFTNDKRAEVKAKNPGMTFLFYLWNLTLI